MSDASASSSGSGQLERGAIGLTEVLFQSITFMAPAVATALSIGFATTLAGSITPLAIVFALIAVLFTAYSAGQLGSRMSSAGGMYTWVSRGLGPFFGWLVAWIFTLAGPIVPPALYASFGFFGAALITELTGFSNDWLWLVLAVVCGALVWALSYYGIRLSTRVGVVLGLIEIGIFIVVSILLIGNAAKPVDTSVFIPSDGNVLPALQGMVFCLLAFVGFEGAAPLGEEAREPRRTIPRAMLLSAVAIGLFYIFCYYAAAVFFGPANMTGSNFIDASDANPWGGMAEQVLPGIGSLLVTFAIVNSSLANANAGANASTRVIFSLGRTGLLPGTLAAVHPTHRTPVNAVHAQGILGLVLAVGLSLFFNGESNGGPLTTYFFIGYVLGLAFAAMYIAVNAASIGYFLGEGRADFNPLKHLVVPVLGIVAMAVAFVSTIGGVTIPILNVEISALPTPFSYAPPLVLVWALAGVVLYFMLRMRNPQATAEIGAAVAEA